MVAWKIFILIFVYFSSRLVQNLGNNNLSNTSIKKLLMDIDFIQKEELIEKIEEQKAYSWDEIRLQNDILLKVDILPIKDEDFIFLGTLILFQDISLDRNLENYLIQNEKMASVAEVAVGVAHEINNPLSIIQNYIELLKNRKLDKDISKKLGKIEKELDRIVKIVSSLLSFSRIRCVHTKAVNLQHILNDVILLLQHNILEKNVLLKKYISNTDIEIIGDENRLKQLFINLIINSIEAVLDNGIIKIYIESYDSEGYVQIKICDNGYGIPNDVKEKIFNPFFSTKINKKNTGLGLSISRQIVEEHGGLIECFSKPGKFTEFTVYLPTKRR